MSAHNDKAKHRHKYSCWDVNTESPWDKYTAANTAYNYREATTSPSVIRIYLPARAHTEFIIKFLFQTVREMSIDG